MNQKEIDSAFYELYNLLKESESLEAETALGFVAQAQAVWFGEDFEEV